MLGGEGRDLLNGGPGFDLLDGQGGSDVCLDGGTVRRCERATPRASRAEGVGAPACGGGAATIVGTAGGDLLIGTGART